MLKRYNFYCSECPSSAKMSSASGGEAPLTRGFALGPQWELRPIPLKACALRARHSLVPPALNHKYRPESNHCNVHWIVQRILVNHHSLQFRQYAYSKTKPCIEWNSAYAVDHKLLLSSFLMPLVPWLMLSVPWFPRAKNWNWCCYYYYYYEYSAVLKVLRVLQGRTSGVVLSDWIRFGLRLPRWLRLLDLQMLCPKSTSAQIFSLCFRTSQHSWRYLLLFQCRQKQ